MLRIWSRNALFVVLFLIIASCSGGGCSSGCGGCTKPISGGFDKAKTVTNAGSVRVTRPGLDFLQTNLPALAATLIKANNGELDFQIPSSQTQTSLLGQTITIKICPNGPKPGTNPPQCVANIKIGDAKLHIDAVTPHSVKVSGTIPVRLQDLPINASVIGDFDIGVGSGNGCDGNGVPQVDYKAFPVDIELPLIAETIDPRTGFTKVDAANAVVNVDIQSGDVTACKDCGLFSPICDAIIGFVKDQAFGTLKSGVEDQLKQQLQSQLCTKPDPTQMPSCPFGSQPDDPDPMKAKTCVYTSDPKTCMPQLLGTQGHMDLGAALASISPGTQGGIDFELAANGDMDPAPGAPPDGNGYTTNGITLGLLGGTAEAPKTTCVPVANNPPPMGIPIPDEMTKDKIAPWPMGDTGPHLGIALAGRFLNYAMVSLYNSGLLCLGVSTEQFQQLNSGYLSLVVPSMKKLTFEQKPAAAAITTRPQAPPKVKIGGGTDIKKDPLLTIQLDKFAVDFYVWSEDRFVRAFTFTADVTVPVNLTTAKDPKTNPNGGLLPTIGDLGVANATVTNTDLLLDSPQTLAGAIQGLLGGIVGQFLGKGFSPIDLSGSLKSLGLAMTIPPEGIRKLTKGTDDYLAIFADLALAPGTMSKVDTRASLVSTTVHPEAMSLETAVREKFPTLRVALDAPDAEPGRAVEYAWWIDDGTRSPWTTEREVTVDQDVMLLQGKHVLHVVARYAGQAATEDESPAELPFTIDTLAPHVSLSSRGEQLTVKAWDFVSPDEALLARVRVSESPDEIGQWSAWAPLAEIAGKTYPDTYSVDVEVQDEMGNVGSTSNQLITGRPDPTLKAAGSGCGCSTPGTSGAGIAWLSSLGVGLALVAFGLRRRRVAPAIALGGIAALAATNEGCACGSDDNADNGTGCGQDCHQVCGAANAIGMVGAYTSVAKAKDGTIWVAGYDDADVAGGNLWGDLVVGKYDSGKQQVGWSTVDGLPPARTDGTCPPNDPTGWRGGETDSGDDVGLWTSLALDANDNPMVSYYDATHTALKFASVSGTDDHGNPKWQSHTVKQAAQSDIGRYSKMILIGGNPTIAFLVMEKGNMGHMRSKVVLAHANVAVPQGPGDWTFEDAAVDENGPCRAQFCDLGQSCIKETGQCQATVNGCTPACATSGGLGTAAQACVTIMGKPACGTVVDQTHVDSFPNAFADYISMANGPNGIGIVMYDRLHGNLVGVSKQAGKWTAQILDGETGSRANNTAMDTGDVGFAASLAIAPNGDWHVSYGNGFTEAMQYMLVKGGTMPGVPEIVDNGQGNGTTPFPDGQHLVGQDSTIAVDANGVVTIAYQDSTVGTLHVANGSPSGATHKWSVKIVSQPSRFAGFFPQVVPGSNQFTNFWRQADVPNGNMLGDVSFVAP